MRNAGNIFISINLILIEPAGKTANGCDDPGVSDILANTEVAGSQLLKHNIYEILLLFQMIEKFVERGTGVANCFLEP